MSCAEGHKNIFTSKNVNFITVAFFRGQFRKGINNSKRYLNNKRRLRAYSLSKKLILINANRQKKCRKEKNTIKFQRLVWRSIALQLTTQLICVLHGLRILLSVEYKAARSDNDVVHEPDPQKLIGIIRGD